MEQERWNVSSAMALDGMEAIRIKGVLIAMGGERSDVGSVMAVERRVETSHVVRLDEPPSALDLTPW
jgi:hypothetical protein